MRHLPELVDNGFYSAVKEICARHLSWIGHDHDYDDCHAGDGGDHNDHGDFAGHDITIVDFRLVRSIYVHAMYVLHS